MKNKLNIIEIPIKEIKINKQYEKLVRNITDEQYKLLESDVKRNGITYPIILNEGYEIIDGHNRYKIAKMLELKTIPANVKVYSDELEESRDVVILNYARRQMTPGQQIESIVFLLSVETKLAEKRMLSGKSNPTTTLEEGHSTKGEAAKIVADKLGLGRTTVTKIKKIMEMAKVNPEFADKFEKFKDGKEKSSVSKLYKDALKISEGEETSEGTIEGKTEETSEGTIEGKTEETSEGTIEGKTEETSEGTIEGKTEETSEGTIEGKTEETSEGTIEGKTEETSEGTIEEAPIQIEIKPSVKRRLKNIMLKYTQVGDDRLEIKTDSDAIRYALRKAELWDID